METYPNLSSLAFVFLVFRFISVGLEYLPEKHESFFVYEHQYLSLFIVFSIVFAVFLSLLSDSAPV